VLGSDPTSIASGTCSWRSCVDPSTPLWSGTRSTSTDLHFSFHSVAEVLWRTRSHRKWPYSYVYAISRRNPPDSRMLMSSIRLAQRHMPNRFVFGFQHVEKYMYLVSAHICRSTSQSDHSKKIPIFSEHLPPLSNPNYLQRDLQETPKMHSKTLLTVFALATAVAAIPVPNSGSTESLGQEISDVFGSPFGNGTKPWAQPSRAFKTATVPLTE
jgi:hypothetical protein